MNTDKTKLALFEEKEIRRKQKDNDWYFSVIDVVAALTDSANPKEYIKKIRQRDEELKKLIIQNLLLITRDYYKLKGYNEQWIWKRMFVIEARNQVEEQLGHSIVTKFHDNKIE